MPVSVSVTVARRGSCRPTWKLILLCTVTGLVLQEGDAANFPQVFGVEVLDPFFFSVSKRGPCFTAIEEDGGNKDL